MILLFYYPIQSYIFDSIGLAIRLINNETNNIMNNKIYNSHKRAYFRYVDYTSILLRGSNK